MSKKDPENMTVDELVEHQVALKDQINSIREEMAANAEILDRKTAAERAIVALTAAGVDPVLIGPAAAILAAKPHGGD